MSQRFALLRLPLVAQLQANSPKEILKLAEMTRVHADQEKNTSSVMVKAETLLLLVL